MGPSGAGHVLTGSTGAGLRAAGLLSPLFFCPVPGPRRLYSARSLLWACCPLSDPSPRVGTHAPSQQGQTWWAWYRCSEHCTMPLPAGPQVSSLWGIVPVSAILGFRTSSRVVVLLHACHSTCTMAPVVSPCAGDPKMTPASNGKALCLCTGKHGPTHVCFSCHQA